MILGVLVLVTAIYETTRGRKRTLRPSRVTLRQRLHNGITSGGDLFFDVYFLGLLVMSVVGGVRNADRCGFETNLRELMIVFGVLVLICVCGMVWGWSSRETSEGRGTQASRAPFHFWPSAVAVTAGSICLLAVPSVATRAIPASKDCYSAAPQRRVERARHGSAAPRLL